MPQEASVTILSSVSVVVLLGSTFPEESEDEIFTIGVCSVGHRAPSREAFRVDLI